MLSYFCLLLVSISAQSTPGLRTALSDQAFEDFKNTYFPSLLQELTQNGLPPTSFSENLYIATVVFNITQTTFTTLSMDMENTNIGFDAANQTLLVEIRGLEFDLTSQFEYYIAALGWTQGTFFMYLQNASITVPITVGVDDLGRLNVSVQQPIEDFSDLQYQFETNSVLENILSFIGGIPPFTYIDTLLMNLLFTTSISSLGTSLHTALQTMSYQAQVGPVVADYRFTNANVTTDMFLVAGINGTFYPVNSNATVPFSPSTVVSPWISDGKFRLQLSEYTLNTLTWALYSSNLMKYNITSNSIPKNIPILLTTTGLSILLPALQKTYGPNKPVNFNCYATQAPTIAISSTLDLTVFGACDVIVMTGTTQSVAFTIMMEMNAQATATLFSSSKGTYIAGIIIPSSTQFSQFTYVNSLVGPLDLSSLAQALGVSAGLIAGALNQLYLSQGVLLPLPQGVHLSNCSTYLQPGIMEIDATPSFALLVNLILDALH